MVCMSCPLRPQKNKESEGKPTKHNRKWRKMPRIWSQNTGLSFPALLSTLSKGFHMIYRMERTVLLSHKMVQGFNWDMNCDFVRGGFQVFHYESTVFIIFLSTQ